MGKMFNKDGTLYIPVGEKLTFKEKVIEEEGQTVITEAYCQNGHNLICDVKIDRQNGVRLLYTDQEGTREAEIVISPVVGNRTKVYVSGELFEVGDTVKVLCPTCRKELPVLLMCQCGAPVYLAYLDKGLNPKHAQSFCSRIGCTKASQLRFSQTALTEFMSQYVF